MDVDVQINEDYAMSGAITYFEAYMFSTSEKHIAKQNSFDNQFIITEHNGEVQSWSMENVETRKKALSTFNKYLKDTDCGFPNPKKLGVFIIDFVFDSYPDDYLEQSYELLAKIENAIVKWAIDNNRTVAIAEHLQQDLRVPHLHIIYNKIGREKNKLQEYLLNNINI